MLIKAHIDPVSGANIQILLSIITKQAKRKKQEHLKTVHGRKQS